MLAPGEEEEEGEELKTMRQRSKGMLFREAEWLEELMHLAAMMEEQKGKTGDVDVFAETREEEERPNLVCPFDSISHTTCPHPCCLSDCGKCFGTCDLDKGHDEDEPHLCRAGAKGHVCGKAGGRLCALEGCDTPCRIPVILGGDGLPHHNHEHDHAHSNRCDCLVGCLHVCEILRCPFFCSNKNHFHAQDSPHEHHLCGESHQCPHKCNLEDGICGIERLLVQVNRRVETVDGVEIQYEKFTKQKIDRKPCIHQIPPDCLTHPEPFHTCREPETHLCGFSCRMCGFFCDRPHGHQGLHDVIHGNSEQFELQSGEEAEFVIYNPLRLASGTARFKPCQMACLGSGWGHVHRRSCLHPTKELCDQAHGGPHRGRRHIAVGPPEDQKFKDKWMCVDYWNEVLKFQHHFDDYDPWG